MFARSIPRATVQAGRSAQCEASHISTKLPSRTWPPLQQHGSRRHASTVREQFRAQFRRSPFMFPLAIASVLAAAGWGAYFIPWYYQNVIIKPYHNFPESVAKKLRRALFYSRGSYMDIKEANKYFRQALQIATEEGMDPFSDEIMGVKYAIAALFEEAGYYAMAVDVLEIMRADCQRWMDEFSDRHWNNGNRARVKKNMVQICVKLGSLYDTKYVNEPDDAEKRLVEAVESVLMERQRRETEGLKPGEGEFMTDDEAGATLEALGQHYEQYDSQHLALPLFVRALGLCPPKSCHSVILMNNISTSLAQQTASPSAPATSTPPRAVFIQQASQWATKALARASSITPPDRNEECDVGCAVATHNLGEFLEMEGKLKEARGKYEEARSLAKAVGFADGVTNAKQGIERLKMLEKQKKNM
ncbi:hypothetical protein P280DRAFT_393646 [Massarina eburnea CBS 473.64]|uniref:TPR domain-containing protein n=1 Tax=Massarina eburnea CBS 473.64 TaxID=1395130 RepID=A0A6A6S7M3_9PLEO|nr:hypothetical protein P280DRAFT_393646 [Massarina eburnea CBS 473.64]